MWSKRVGVPRFGAKHKGFWRIRGSSDAGKIILIRLMDLFYVSTVLPVDYPHTMDQLTSFIDNADV